MEKPKFVYVTIINTTPAKLWKAITTPEFTRQYFFDTSVESDWKIGSPMVYRKGDRITDEGKVLKFQPPKVLSYTFRPVLVKAMRVEPPSRVTFEIESMADAKGVKGKGVRLTVTHDHFPPRSKVLPAISHGWPIILSNLKTLLETGKTLPLQKGAM